MNQPDMGAAVLADRIVRGVVVGRNPLRDKSGKKTTGEVEQDLVWWCFKISTHATDA